MTQHTESPRPSDDPKVTLRSPADLAAALPYLCGFHPDDSILLIALHGERGRFGGRARLGIPRDAAEWPGAAQQLAECLVNGSEQRGGRPDAIVLFLVQEPAPGETPHQLMERLRPLAQRLRIACGTLDVPVVEALCVCAGRWWSYCCPDPERFPREGIGITKSGDSVMAAAAAYAGLRISGSLKEIEERLTPPPPGAPASAARADALDAAAAALVPRMLERDDSAEVRRTTLRLLRAALERFRAATPVGDGVAADRDDDALLDDDEAATMILGLQDRTTRDEAAEWMDPPHTDPAVRLWRALARRCVEPYHEHAAAPLTLAGWVAWSAGDEAAARVAFGRALHLAPDYTFARLLHAAVNNGLSPEPLRRYLRQQSIGRARRAALLTARRGPAGSAGRGPGRRSPGARRARTRR
ncbi:DUF4192 domain-containing protein [Actinacidiphila sp. bgisy160]|uniref:DUF4192 domain-containing protein n=1 Tax=Actinacidiphila sp. bgisy160 TaxID=3413796 RepID=UPI003D74C8D8